MVVSQNVSAGAGEGQVASVECEDVLTVDDYGANCGKQIYAREVGFKSLILLCASDHKQHQFKLLKNNINGRYQTYV